MKEYRTILMNSPQLQMDKHVYVYLPKDYDQSEQSYPVLYMHDGQNLLDDKTAHMNHGWHLMDQFDQHPDAPQVIVAGIESTGQTRTNQLIPFPFVFPKANKSSGGQADAYLDFIVNTVKPIIDRRFRTKSEAEYTAMMGSSFGGVNTLYAGLVHGDVFSRFGCLSGAFHYRFFEPLFARLQESDLSHVKRFHMDTGTDETEDPKDNENYLSHNRKVADELTRKLDSEKFRFQVIEGGRHHESDWEARFIDILSFLFQE